ncbi:hypothetical protein HW132_08000 [Brasilonema sp. CT11]|nr:hypothetical protein [Brasilonema sp. CT11]
MTRNSVADGSSVLLDFVTSVTFLSVFAQPPMLTLEECGSGQSHQNLYIEFSLLYVGSFAL